jgi:hypothetical protein
VKQRLAVAIVLAAAAAGAWLWIADIVTAYFSVRGLVR